MACCSFNTLFFSAAWLIHRVGPQKTPKLSSRILFSMTARLANSCSVVAVDVFMVLALATPAQARSVMATVVLILFICNVLLRWLANPADQRANWFMARAVFEHGKCQSSGTRGKGYLVSSRAPQR